ncbi:flavin reductase family protein [Novosphingobium terrae]|uniref:flavin reductase family protein n=1 Tax=Novosphingobium terrae TaxID=2726189 RepID=UPI00197FFD14|nr:flavin reductase family protein [Novosphingobium terrae]
MSSPVAENSSPSVEGGAGLSGATQTLDKALFRQALGRFATGVTVITTMVGEDVHGMTASAFMSGSLEPPLVVISIARKARIHALIEASAVFGVSILHAGQELHGRHFGGQASAECIPGFTAHEGIPMLDDALASIAATVEHAYACGDHTLFLGRVRHLRVTDGEPLLHFTGNFRKIG